MGAASCRDPDRGGTHLPFVITRHVNRVRDPDGYDRMARAKQTVFTGMLVNQMI